MQNISMDYSNVKENNDLKQVIKWILSDVQLIQKGIEIADEKRLFENYTRLT